MLLFYSCGGERLEKGGGIRQYYESEHHPPSPGESRGH